MGMTTATIIQIPTTTFWIRRMEKGRECEVGVLFSFKFFFLLLLSFFLSFPLFAFLRIVETNFCWFENYTINLWSLYMWQFYLHVFFCFFFSSFRFSAKHCICIGFRNGFLSNFCTRHSIFCVLVFFFPSSSLKFEH